MPISIELYFGDNKLPQDNVSIGEFELKTIPPAPTEPKEIELLVSLDSEQTLILNSARKRAN